MAMSSDSQSSFHSNSSVASSSANQASLSPWPGFSRMVAEQAEMQNVLPNRVIDTYRSYLQNEPSENSSKFQQALSEFGSSCPLSEPIFDPGSSNPMREPTSVSPDNHQNWSNSPRDNWIEMLDALPKNIIDTYKSYLHREPSENNLRFRTSADECGSRRFIDESRFQLDESVHIKDSRSAPQDDHHELTDDHRTEDMEIEDIEEVEMQEIFPDHIFNIHQQKMLSEDSSTHPESQSNCVTDDSRVQSDHLMGSEEFGFIEQCAKQIQVTTLRNEDFDIDNVRNTAMMNMFCGHILDAYEPMEQLDIGFEFPRIITSSAPKCLDCEHFVSMAGLLPDAPPEDYAHDADVDVIIEPEGQAWFYLPYMEELQQSVHELESQTNEVAVQSDVSSDNDDYDSFPQCDLSLDADIIESHSLNIEHLEDMSDFAKSETQSELLLEKLSSPKPETPSNEKICSVKPEMSATRNVLNVKAEMPLPEKICDTKPEMLAADLKQEMLFSNKLSNLKQETSGGYIKTEKIPLLKTPNFKAERILISSKLSSVKEESDSKPVKPELLSVLNSSNIKPENSSNSEMKPSSEKVPYIKSEMQIKKKPAKELPYLCTECGQRYLVCDQLEQHLWDHIAEMNGKHPFTCLKCPGRRFLNMKLHEQHHRMGLECNVCGQAFHAAIVIAEHKMRVHTTSKIVKCKICRKSFTSSSELSRHKKRRHSKSKPFKCKICELKFEDKDALASHNRHHESEKQTKATKSDELQSHGPTDANSKLYESDAKSRSCTDKQDLKDHALRKEEKCRKCKECSYSSSSSSSLKKHMKKHHEDKIFECKRCDRWYLKNDDLHSHTEKHHRSKDKQKKAGPDAANEKEEGKH